MRLGQTRIMQGVLLPVVLLLSACGGGGGGGAPAGGSGTTGYTVGGSISGLTGSVVLQNNSGDNTTANTNGTFTFTTKVNNSAAYNVTVATQPVGQFCIVTNGSGVISAANVTNVAVSCRNITGSPPAQPSTLAATTLSEASVRVTWVDNSLDETGFYVERSTSASGPFMQVPVSANTATYTDSGLTPSTLYYYRVAAYNANGISPYVGTVSTMTSAPAATAPAAPSGLSATAASTTSISLFWADNSDNETGFKIERATSAAGPFAQIFQADAGATSYTDAGLTASTTYYYQVRATNSTGDSAYTSVASATTPATATVPVAPSGLTATPASTTSISLSWTDNSTDETGFQIEYGPSATGPFTLITTTAANVTSYSHTGLTASTAYYYRIRATNGAGDSANTTVVSATTPAAATPPATPSGLAATAASPTSISLSWADNSNNETGFKIERGTSASGPFAQIILVGAGSTSYSDTGLNASTTYYYQVRATNSTGDSAYTPVASATTPATVIIPLAPSGLTATTASATSISLSWTDNSNNETAFKIERGASTSGPFVQITTTSANAASFDDSGLTALTTYYYRLRATNSAGDSSYSSVASATTSAASATVNLYPVNDNLLMMNSTNTATANTSYPSGNELAVGCGWNYWYDSLASMYIQDVLCGQSLMKFNVAALAGKTIDSATLKLTTDYAGVGYYPRNWYIAALISSWTSTVTWNIASTFTYDITTKQIFAPPTNAGQIYNVNVSSIVQAWADGTTLNNGLILETTDYSFPYATSVDYFAFYSSEAGGSVSPILTVTYH